MKEFIDKLIGRLEEIKKQKVGLLQLQDRDFLRYSYELRFLEEVKEIVNQLAEEYINTSTDTSTDTSTTNADRIRSMTDEELAEFFYSTDHNVDEWNCIVKLGNVRLQDNEADILAWLQSEVEGVTENE